jgi:hypothetical protein
MKILPIIPQLLLISAILLTPAAAQTNAPGPASASADTNLISILVTNWVDAWPSLRTVDGRLYDSTYSELWQSVAIPEGATVLGAVYTGSVQPTDLTFIWGSHEQHDEQNVTVKNFPYNPNDFSRSGHEHGVVATAAPMILRLLPISIQTNWSPLGKMWIGPKTYDYGLPYVGTVPVPTWKQVPASQVAIQSPAPVPVPRPFAPDAPPQSAAPDASSLYSGPLANRLKAAMSITRFTKKDETLAMLAQDAAEQGDVAIARSALKGMVMFSERDRVAREVAHSLVMHGNRTEALEIVRTITNPSQRLEAMQELGY